MSKPPVTAETLRDFHDAHPYGPPLIHEGPRKVADQFLVASLLLELQAIRKCVLTAPEERTADECIAAVRKVFGVTE